MTITQRGMAHPFVKRFIKGIPKVGKPMDQYLADSIATQAHVRPSKANRGT